ncbi:MAG: 1-acyl-sn-glycerol-3-phosphate acyltransferase [Myxococcales bacterium]|nr:1-acyl-sn-glycerol-3-phosphate acyltransferase [Myxococcales bacterium]
MRKEDQERVVTELVSRVCERHMRTHTSSEGRSHLQDVLEDSLYFERQRLELDGGKSPAYSRDLTFWHNIQIKLRHATEPKLQQLIREVIHGYVFEIQGHFNPRVYALATKALPSGLGLLLNAVSPLKVLRNLPQLPRLEDRIIIEGQVAQLQRLHQRGTVVFVPTHASNLDSPVVGFALYKMGLPPFLYGAGLNLFTNPLLSFFMRNLGAYTVDRKKTDPLYKDILKEYATISLENKYDNLFFPGGTRSRSGAIEKKLKRGLLGCGLAAYINNLQRRRAKPKIFIVPCTINSQLVLEAETLIDDFLKEVGKSRYIIDDDEFSQPRRVFDFAAQLSGLDSKIHIRVSSGLDVFGNPVDENGISLTPGGHSVDDRRYLLKGDQITSDPSRDHEYTRELALSIEDAFSRNNIVTSTHVTARAIFLALRRRNPSMSLLRLIRTGGVDDDLPISTVYQTANEILEKLIKLERTNRICRSPSSRGTAEAIIADGLKLFGIYHTRAAAKRSGDRIIPTDRTLLLYYQNRLEGYELPGGDVLDDDNRVLRPTHHS